MRIDKLLWFLRFVRSRNLAQALVEQGHIRCNGKRVERLHHKIGPGDVLVVPLPGGVRVFEVLTLPERRGPALEAQSCYRVLDEQRDYPIAAGQQTTAAKGNPQP